MVDRISDCRSCSLVDLRADAIVVTTTMIGQVDRLKTYSVPIVELLCHVIVINLMQDHIKLVQLGKDAHLELPSPCSILPNRVNVIINLHISIHIELVLFFVGTEVLNHVLTELAMIELLAKQLISHGPEEAVTIGTDFLQPQSLLS